MTIKVILLIKLKGWLAYQLKSQVIYLETAMGERYEMSKQQNEHSKIFGEYNQFKFAKLKEPFLTDNEFFQNEDVPLNGTHIKVIFTDLEWDEFQWGKTDLKVKDLSISGKKILSKIQTYFVTRHIQLK